MTEQKSGKDGSMNKQELIKKYEKKHSRVSMSFEAAVLLAEIQKDLKQLDEPQRVVVEQFVDDYIKHAKEKDWDLQDLFEFVGDEDRGGLREWFYDGCNQETLALAWIFGYEVKEEKRYTIKFKNIRKETRYLKYDRVVEDWYFGVKQYSKETKIYHTRKEIEDAGFGWVFDCTGIEIEEVEG